MEIMTQEYGSVRCGEDGAGRKGGWCKLFAVLVLMAIMVIARPESAKADVNFSGAAGLTFDDEGCGAYEYTDKNGTARNGNLNSSVTYYFELQASSLVGIYGSSDFQLYNDNKELVYEGSYGYILLSMNAGRYYVYDIYYINLIKQWEGDDSFNTIRLTQNESHTIYRNYCQWKTWWGTSVSNAAQIVAPITFSVEKGHVYRISTSNLDMDIANYSTYADCVIKDGVGAKVVSEPLQLNNGYLDYKATATCEMTMNLSFSFQTDASFDISYKDVTCEVSGHLYGEYTVTKKATVTSKGKKIATCTVCGKENTKTINYKTGVAKASDGKKYYYKSGNISTTTTGLVKCDGKIYKIKKGKVLTSFTGIAKYKSKYYYLKKGVSQNDLTSMVKVEGTWYYVDKGVISFKKNGVVKSKGQLWYVKESQLCTSKTGVVKYGKNYIYVKKGKCSQTFTGIVDYGEERVYVEDGYVRFDYLGKIKYKGKTYNIRGGYVV